MHKFIQILFVTAVLIVASRNGFANNLSVTNVNLSQRNLSAKTVVVQFDVSWNNSWRNKINHDAVWLTVRLLNSQNPSLGKSLCSIAAVGVNPSGSSVGSQSDLEFYVPSDAKGAFLRRSNYGNVADVKTQGAHLTIKYDSCGFSDTDQISASIFGLEMVYIPQGSFYAGDLSHSQASLTRGSSDSNPWPITSENQISVTNPTSGAYRYSSAGNSGEYASGSSFVVPANYPKGYGAFYIMKYELTEGQWVEFLNSIPATGRLNRDLTDSAHKNSDDVINRNTISCAGSPLSCSTQRSSRPASFLSWMDLAAFLDWNAMRPMTELEFEKIARGPAFPLAGEYAWSTTDLTAGQSISGVEDGTETITTDAANANFGNTVLTGGDASQGADYQTGPVRAGIFASNTTDRVKAGAGYYGVFELSGNVKEYAVTLGNAKGLGFTGIHGDGILSSVTGSEGNANTEGWPGKNGADAGIVSFDGIGLRGGSWADDATKLTISDRSEAALGNAITVNAQLGGRGARSYDGN